MRRVEHRTMTGAPTLSKSRLLAGAQCHLRLWLETHRRDLAPAPDACADAAAATGREVEALARRRFPGGRLIGDDDRPVGEAIEETRLILEAGTAGVLFEAAFVHRGVLVRTDVLERLPEGGWRLVEVKSATRLAEHFVLDVAVQLGVLRGAGIDVRDAAVLTLDRGYVYDGERLDLDALFTAHPVFDEAMARIHTVDATVRAMQAMLARADAPRIAPGPHCFNPHPCPYHAHCTRGHVGPEHPVDALPRLGANRRAALEAAGIVDIRDIPDDFPLTALQRIVRRSVRERRPVVHGDVAGALAGLKPPVRHLDFETFAPAIPRFAGTRPHDTVPFLYSVHTEHDGAPPEHTDYLDESADDPRTALAERLIEAVGTEGTICTWSGYERTVLRALTDALPHRAEALRAIEARLFDLLAVVRATVYHPGFRASFSLKRVAPALVPGIGYDDLAIADGQRAAVEYAAALASPDCNARRRIFEDLRAYCARDTRAMVEVRRALARLATALAPRIRSTAEGAPPAGRAPQGSPQQAMLGMPEREGPGATRR